MTEKLGITNRSRFRRSVLATLLWEITLAGFCSAKYHHQRWSVQNRGWGRKSHVKKITLSPQSNSLESYLSQVRGGSSYGDDDGKRNQDGYYSEDRYDRGYSERDWAKQEEYGDYKREDFSSRGSNDVYRDDYDDRGRPRSSSSSNAVQHTLSSFQAKIKNGDRRIGVPLLGLGVVFTVLGISLFFNKSLMRLGNLMIIAGVPTTIGPSRTAGYFLQPQKTRATACLFAGIFLVFVGWPIFGIALEVFGILNLFGNMFPMFWAIFKNMPIVSSITKNAGGGGGGSRGQSYERDRDYDRDPYGDDRRSYDDYRDDEAEGYY